MGTSLTGLTPATTYDALIKVTDNGPLSGTAKYLSDGLGNDSVLALSTSSVGIGTASPSATLNIKSASSNNSDNLGQVLTNSEFRLQYRADDLSSLYIGGLGSERGYLQAVNNAQSGGADISLNPYGGNVGIGTSAPNSKLEVFAETAIYPINITSSSGSATTTGISMGSFTGLAGGSNGSVYIASAHNHSATAQSAMVFYTHTGSALTEKGRFLAGGGLTFNGDTAAANALDDYEEGTFTPVFTTTGTGFTSGGNASVGRYTKIGNLVTVQINAVLSGAVSGGTGNVIITGMPFTSAVSAYGVFSSGRVTISGNNYFATIINGTTSIQFGYLNSGLLATTLPASDINGNSTPFISTTITYQV